MNFFKKHFYTEGNQLLEFMRIGILLKFGIVNIMYLTLTLVEILQ